VGRAARGEAWRFDLLDSGTIVRDSEGLLFKDRLILSCAQGWGGLGAAEGMAYVATIACLSPSYGRLEDLASSLSTALEGSGLEARAGVAILARGGLVVRLLARSAPALQRAIDLAWTGCRDGLWSLGPLALRKM
jgi:urease accessory protein UreH